MKWTRVLSGSALFGVLLFVAACADDGPAASPAATPTLQLPTETPTPIPPTPTSTLTPTPTSTNTLTPTNTHTAPPTGTPTGTPTPTVTLTPTVTNTPTPTQVVFTGTCAIPDLDGNISLLPCIDGTVVNVFRCNDRNACSYDEDASTLVGGATIIGGGFQISVDPSLVQPGDLILITAVVDMDFETIYRLFTSVPATAAVNPVLSRFVPAKIVGIEVLIDPNSEAAVRLLDDYDTEYDNAAIQTITDAVRAVNNPVNVSFAGLYPDEAADFAYENASADPTVQSLLETLLLPTPTPLASPTTTATPPPSGTPTAAPTDTSTQSPTDTPTQAPTDTPTQAPTDTPL